MGLFHRQEENKSEVLYTVGIGNEKTKLIVGLGNPGPKYHLTRHNLGFECLDAFVTAENGSWTDKKNFKCLVSELRIGSTRVILVKPTTFMNLSGEAVQAVQHFYKIGNQDMLVVHDELDIPFGQIRTRLGGSGAGHNGVKSLIQHIGDDFGRVRIGIANDLLPKVDSAAFVLQKLSKSEQGNLKALKTEVSAIINEYIFGDSIAADTRSYL